MKKIESAGFLSDDGISEKEGRWEKKIEELKIPDKYGYVIEPGIIETVAALQLLEIDTAQSDEGDELNVPWIQLGGKRPNDLYVGEHELKIELMNELGVSPEEIDPESPRFSREKQVDVEEEARERLSASKIATYTHEFEKWREETQNLANKLLEYINDFYSTRSDNRPSDTRITLEFPYRAPQYPSYIRDTPFLRATSLVDGAKPSDISEEYRKLSAMTAKREMEQFTEYLKNKLKHK